MPDADEAGWQVAATAEAVAAAVGAAVAVAYAIAAAAPMPGMREGEVAGVATTEAAEAAAIPGCFRGRAEVVFPVNTAAAEIAAPAEAALADTAG
jgi:hypothetical protein